MGRMTGRNASRKQGEESEPVHKRERMPKKRVLDGEYDDDEDDEIQCLEKLEDPRLNMGHKEFDEDSNRKQQKLTSVFDIELLGTFKASKDAKRKSIADRVSKDTDNEEEEGLRVTALTARQRAIQSRKDASGGPKSSLEFPNR